MDTNTNPLEQFEIKKKKTTRGNWTKRSTPCDFLLASARRVISWEVLCTENMANNKSQLDEHDEEGIAIISITKSRLLPTVVCPAAAVVVAADDYCSCRNFCWLDRCPMLNWFPSIDEWFVSELCLSAVMVVGQVITMSACRHSRRCRGEQIVVETRAMLHFVYLVGFGTFQNVPNEWSGRWGSFGMDR